jgi:hypothetical protein
MPKVFISYRREDSQDVAGRIYDRLRKHLPDHDLFKDVDSIPAGVDFRTALRGAVEQCDVMLIVIGPQWLTATDGQDLRRLDSPQDYVRLEVEAALARDITVIPVLVSHARMPGEQDLPVAIGDLAFRNARSVRPDPDFHLDMDRLVRAIGFDPQEVRATAVAPVNDKDTGECMIEATRTQICELAGYSFRKTIVTRELYLAEDQKTGRLVEVAVARRCELDMFDLSSDEWLYRASATTRIEHPNVLRVIEVIPNHSAEDSVYYVIREHVDGVGLLEGARAQARGRGANLFDAAARLFERIARGLHQAHAQAVVHGDLKPSEVVVDEAGIPHIRFPGIPRIGTPAYISPEAATGTANAIDGRADIWSAGVMLYECLTNRRPFREGREYLHTIISQDPKPPRQYEHRIPVELEQICLRCLNRSPSDRYPTALDLADALQVYLNRWRWLRWLRR